MTYLLDTNILVRLASPFDPKHVTAATAVSTLRGRGERLCLNSQNLIEFRNVATRPLAANGLGLTAAEADAAAARFEADFPLLPDTPAIYPAWKVVVASAGVIGKQVHDARLVAVCHVHGATHIVTFNTAHFARLAAVGPGLVVVDPAAV